MKRALVVLLALCTLGVLAFGIETISGDWSFTFRVLGTGAPAARSSVLNLKTTINGWTITSKTTFGDIDDKSCLGNFDVEFGFVEQAFGLKGTFGPVTIDAGMAFNAGQIGMSCWDCVEGEDVCDYITLTPPAYKSAFLSTSLDLAGLNIGIKVEHWAYPYKCPWPCDDQTGSYMLYTMTLGVAPVKVEAKFADCCTGIEFSELVLTMEDVGLCCGITYDVEFSFTKAGFEYVQFDIENFFNFCCGITFDLSVKFTVDEKEVTLTPKFAGLGEGCVTIWADVDEDLDLIIYGWKVGCSFGDCGLLEFGHWTGIEPPYKDCSYPSWYYPFYYYGDEYLKFKFCGAGCCGGQYAVDITLWFKLYGKDPGSLFDLKDLRASVSVPIMSNLTGTASLRIPLGTGPVSPTLDLGWKFTF